VTTFYALINVYLSSLPDARSIEPRIAKGEDILTEQTWNRVFYRVNGKRKETLEILKENGIE
jgi:hypothetical protein